MVDCFATSMSAYSNDSLLVSRASGARNYLKITFSFVSRSYISRVHAGETCPDAVPGGLQYSPVRPRPINFVALISNLRLLTLQSITRNP